MQVCCCCCSWGFNFKYSTVKNSLGVGRCGFHKNKVYGSETCNSFNPTLGLEHFFKQVKKGKYYHYEPVKGL